MDFLADSLKNWRIREGFILIALIFVSALTLWGDSAMAIKLSSAVITTLTGGVALTFAIVARSRIALFFSLYAGLCYATNILTTAQPESVPLWIAGLPLAQIATAIHCKSRTALGLGWALFIGWFFAIISGANLSAALSAALIFAIGIAIYRIGKAAAEFYTFSAEAHSMVGWSVAIVAAGYIQQVWLDTSGLVLGIQPPDFWVAGVSICASVIIISGLVSARAGMLSRRGLIVSVLVSLILPLSIIRPDLIIGAFANIPSIGAAPNFGLMIGAAILASAIGMVVNGLRRNRLIYLIAGASVFGWQALTLVQPSFISAEFAATVLLSLICALAIGGVIAGSKTGNGPIATR